MSGSNGSILASAAATPIVTPAMWGGSMSAPPALSSDDHEWSSALLRYWRDTSPVMEQPPLDHHYIVLHLGGAKRVHRRSPTTSLIVEVEPRTITMVAAGTAYRWRTEGPIEFAHLYLPCAHLSAVAADLGVRAAGGVTLSDRIGCRSERLETLFQLMLHEVEQPRPASAFLLDILLQSFTVDLVHDHSTVVARPVRHAMAPHRLRRVLDYIEHHFADDLRLGDLAALAGTSPYHFSRAFRHETGQPPYRYLISRRIHHARLMLTDTALTIADVARQCGFNSQRQFAIAFRQHAGISPSGYRHVS